MFFRKEFLKDDHSSKEEYHQNIRIKDLTLIFKWISLGINVTPVVPQQSF